MERSPGPINVLLWGWVRLLLLWCYSLWVCAISFAGVLKEHLQFCQTEVHSFFRIKGLGFGKVAALPTVCWFFSPLTRAADRHQSNLSPGLLPWKRETERESERKNERCGREYRAEVIESWLSSQAFLASLKHIRRNTLSHAKILPISHAGVLHNLLLQSPSLSAGYGARSVLLSEPTHKHFMQHSECL